MNGGRGFRVPTCPPCGVRSLTSTCGGTGPSRGEGGSHINAVDGGTQCQLVATGEKIREASQLPVIGPLWEGWPCVLLGFHADHGSESLNDQGATRLEKLRIACPTSRPRHSNAHALVESKHGAVVRPHGGSAHLPQPGQRVLGGLPEPVCQRPPPVLLPETITDAKGTARQGDRDTDRKTPDETVKSVPEARQYLNLGITGEPLAALASRISDHEAAAWP